MNVSDFKKGPEKLVSPSAPRSEQWLQKKKNPKNLQQESQQLRSVFTRLICFFCFSYWLVLSGLKWAGLCWMKVMSHMSLHQSGLSSFLIRALWCLLLPAAADTIRSVEFWLHSEYASLRKSLSTLCVIYFRNFNVPFLVLETSYQVKQRNHFKLLKCLNCW